jgi:hypothetical protein
MQLLALSLLPFQVFNPLLQSLHLGFKGVRFLLVAESLLQKSFLSLLVKLDRLFEL